LLESFIRTELNATALRRMAVLRPLRVVITNWPEGHVEHVELGNNPENPDDGTRSVPLSGVIYIERDDFRVDAPPKYFRLTTGSEVRLRGAYFLRCTGYTLGDDGEVSEIQCTYDPETRSGAAPDGRKVKATIHWVSSAHALDADVALYERLFVAEVPGERTGEPFDDLHPNSRELVTNCKVEAALGEARPGQVVQFERLGYFARDTGEHLLFHRTVGLRDEWANIQKRG
jgi:glutaminyl-tRNA synthetase